MPDYKAMYFSLMCAVEQSIQLLIKAQQKCEEMLVDSAETQLIPVILQTPTNEDVPSETQ